MKNLLWIISSLLFLVEKAFCEPTATWTSYFRSVKTPELLPLKRSIAGRNYLRGFHKGLYGTMIFPITNESPSKEKDMYTFWYEYFKSTNLGPEATKDFDKFFGFTKKYFCQTAQDTPWPCCQNTQDPGCRTPPEHAMEVVKLFANPSDGLQIAFLYHWCTQAWSSIKKLGADAALKKEAEKYCPDPCLGDPCRSVKRAIKGAQCEVVGPFQDDFKCQCELGYEWDQQLSSCISTNPCTGADYVPCLENNTITCIAEKDGEASCICKPEFMGSDCSLLRDACVERVNKSAQNGNENCQVRLGNRCTPILGTDYYICDCLYGYTPLLTMTEDNCFGRHDPCKEEHFVVGENKSNTESDDYDEDESPIAKRNYTVVTYRSVICLNGGQCVSSSDMTRAACVCPQSSEGIVQFTGLNCEIALGIWSTWTSASPCLPKDCGQMRYSWRRRKCLNTTSSKYLVDLHAVDPKIYSTISSKYNASTRCPGTSEEVLTCDMLEPCTTLRLSGRTREELFNYSSLHYFGYITLSEVRQLKSDEDD
ncbi:hypothetical protein FBUS_04472 [Fasciolopsis buskii]|uniref:EGF-like domain-containing protein n=1 Tax=Fasciolopsis buskii TaxID=27845 RepID=A0A8E0S174_9TREM|nr:hypothetical protein FBUS_04472 [Fasciolopsis buski]